MYISSPPTDATENKNKPPDYKSRVPHNVIALGWVSLITDISSEMITAILPIYLVMGLGLSPLALGFVDGLYGGISMFVRLIGGFLADRFQRRKAIAGFGYGLSAITKLGFLAAGTSIGLIAAVIGVDRIGKGIRTAPRDALISLSSPPESLGRAFGLHRAMDTAGAVMGPLLSFVILWKIPGGYDAIFVVSFCIAIAGLIVLVAFVRDRHNPLHLNQQVSLAEIAKLFHIPDFLLIFILSTLLGLFTLSDAFIFLLLQKRMDVALSFFPLFPLGTASAYFLLSIPLGHLADQKGGWCIFLLGNLALVGVYGLLLSSATGLWLLVLVFGLHGFYYAATNGVLMATIAPSLPNGLQTSGLALIQTGTALSALCSSLLFGTLWSFVGQIDAIMIYCIGLMAMLLLVALYSFRVKGINNEKFL